MSPLTWDAQSSKFIETGSRKVVARKYNSGWKKGIGGDSAL